MVIQNTTHSLKYPFFNRLSRTFLNPFNFMRSLENTYYRKSKNLMLNMPIEFPYVTYSQILYRRIIQTSDVLQQTSIACSSIFIRQFEFTPTYFS